ncbi:MAG: KamA family radical SAM protein [Desulfobacterales bacterium]
MQQTTGFMEASNMAEPAMISDSSTLNIDEDDEPPSSCPTSVLSSNFEQNFCQHPRKKDLILILPRTRAAHTSSLTRFFRKNHYPDINNKLWNDWHWQISHRIRTIQQLKSMISLSDNESTALENQNGLLPFSITPYYMSLVSKNDPGQPIRRTVVPTFQELQQSFGEENDPLGEEEQSPVPGLVHRYPDRVLFLVHDFCSTYCRYCTRSRVVGHGALQADHIRLEKAIEYIRRTSTIRDVLLSGGDPLTLSDDRLDWILTRLRGISHVEIIRIGTKVPVVLPQRITPQLTRMLRRHHPLWMSLHFIHPDECTPEAYRACSLLADAGIPLGSQTVLLKAINDNVDTMKELFHHLMKMRVRPYYLYQCDPITGSAHFRTPIEKGLEIIRGLRGFTSGYAVPTYVVDAPGGGGKIPLMPNYFAGRDGKSILLKNYKDRLYRYPDSSCENILI